MIYSYLSKTLFVVAVGFVVFLFLFLDFVSSGNDDYDFTLRLMFPEP